jgi:hypothetical protein
VQPRACADLEISSRTSSHQLVRSLSLPSFLPLNLNIYTDLAVTVLQYFINVVEGGRKS